MPIKVRARLFAAACALVRQSIDRLEKKNGGEQGKVNR
jgi:hypothetical protein